MIVSANGLLQRRGTVRPGAGVGVEQQAHKLHPVGHDYCINSAALRFILAGDLERDGYGAYRKLFEPAHDT